MSDATDKLSSEEFLDSLTGFEEISVRNKFEADILHLAGSSPTMFTRALAFVLHKRDGHNDTEAWKYAMGLSLRECNGLFAEEKDADDDGDDEGKGDASDDDLQPTQLTTLRTSA